MQSIRRSFNTSELGILIQEEKDVIKSCQRIAKEQAEASKYLAIYGRNEASTDIVDITEKMWVVLDCITTAQSECGRKLEIHRELLKDIRTTEDSLASLKAAEKAAQDRLKDAIKKQKNVELATQTHVDLRDQVLLKESFVACEKRKLLKQALHIKMDAIVEMSAKMSIAATYGKHLADQIPQGQLAPGQALPLYTGKKFIKLAYYRKSDHAAHSWRLSNRSQRLEEPPSLHLLDKRMSNESLQSETTGSINGLFRPETKTRRLSNAALDQAKPVGRDISATKQPLFNHPYDNPQPFAYENCISNSHVQQVEYPVNVSLYDFNTNYVAQSLPTRPAKPSQHRPSTSQEACGNVDDDKELAARIKSLRTND